MTKDWKVEYQAKNVKLTKPVFIEGLPGIANVGKIAVDFLVEELKAKLEALVGSVKKDKKRPGPEIKIEILEIKNPWTSAQLASQWVAGQIEKMVPYRRVIKMALSKVKGQKEVKGVKISVAGRLNGVTISRTEWLKDGRLPRQTIRAIIEYGFTEANCSYGVIGIKVWMYKGDQF